MKPRIAAPRVVALVCELLERAIEEGVWRAVVDLQLVGDTGFVQRFAEGFDRLDGDLWSVPPNRPSTGAS